MGSLAPSRRSAFPPVDGFRVAGQPVQDAGDELSVATPTAGEAEFPEFPGGAMVVVDRLVQGAGVDLASPVMIDRRHDVRKQFGKLRLVVGDHTFAGGMPFGLGAHDLGRYRVPADPARATAALALAVARCTLVACCHWDGQG